MQKFTVLFHPCENLDNYVNNTYSYSPLYTHHFFNQEDGLSAIQWVRYDVYYIVDTFEMYIKVSGQLHMSKEESEIRKSLFVIYKSIFSSIPDYTLILNESTFKNLLYIRSLGSNNFVPPGRIMVEIPLDGNTIFQLRYCVFHEEGNTPSNSPTNEYKSLYKRSHADDEACPELSDKSDYFKNTLDKDHFDEELYDECYMNISHKGNFDNCLIYDIIKHINKSKKERPKNLRKPSSFDRLNFALQENFNILHRRLEWFYHWFIEGASNIRPDSRWSVFLPLIIFTYDPIDAEDKVSPNKISKILTSNDNFKDSIAKREEGPLEACVRSEIMKQPLGVVSELFHTKGKRSPISKKYSQSIKQFSVTILGMVTAYYFFTLNNDRLRISQFMIFPNYNGKGFGLWVLEFIYRFGIMDSTVREITVEDPTSAFQVLRYIVALKLCFESDLVDPMILYGNDKNSLGIFKLFTKESVIPSRDEISTICKESKLYSARLVEILQLANMLPNPISNDFFVNRLSNKRQKTGNIDVKLSLFVQSDMYLNYLDKLKSKLKFEELKGAGKSSKPSAFSPNKYLNSIDSFVDNMCNQTISGYIRVINKLRKIFPKE